MLPAYLTLSKPDTTLHGDIELPGSKSLSNRALLILKLAGVNPVNWLTNLSPARDTLTLRKLLAHEGDIFNAGDGGTTFRFMAAYLALTPEETILTGSPGLRRRPVGPLVKALRELGVYVEYLEKEGYPPLGINATDNLGRGSRTVRIAADVSSQFLSALLMIGPLLPEGLELIPEGTLVSRPYLDMTLRMMRYFGARADWQGETIVVAPGAYEPRPLRIEADWSAASYWYAMAALSGDADLRLRGLHRDSWQGDAVLAGMMQTFGVQTFFDDDGARLLKSRRPDALAVPTFEWDFADCPDLAQTLAVLCAGLGVRGIFSGLETLVIKETDRIRALHNELGKAGVRFDQLPARFSDQYPDKTFYLLDGQAQWSQPPRFATYGDHRMAMSLALLALRGTVQIEHPEVVAKSYPAFWEHLASAGFQVLESGDKSRHSKGIVTE